jgi:hypothetical protein
MPRRKLATQAAPMPAVALVSVVCWAPLPQQTCSCALSRTDPAALAFAKRSLTFEAADCAIAIAVILLLRRTRSRTFLERVKSAISYQHSDRTRSNAFQNRAVDSQ